MDKYKCPKCGGDVRVEIVLTNPAITCYRCTQCDYHHDERPILGNRVIIAPS